VKPLNPRFFLKRLRWEVHLQIRKGDQFVDESWIRMHEVKREIQRLTSEKGTMASDLEAHNNDANWQFAKYKEDVASLEVLDMT